VIGRRAFVRNCILAAAATQLSKAAAVPNSAGTAKPKLKAPASAADCHMHIYDAARFPLVPNPGEKRVPPQNAAVPQYRLLQQRIGTSRVVIVTPRNYATDNRATLDALVQLRPNARGVAVVHLTVTDGELEAYHDAGVRGIRFSLTDPQAAVVTFAMIEPLAKRVAMMNWHVQFNLSGEQIVMIGDLLRRLPSQIVFDHLGQPPRTAGIDHPSHAIIRGLIDKGRTWVKLSGAYSNSTIGPPHYPEATRIAQDFVKAAPERLVWGSDWPHPSEPDGHKPDDAVLFDLLSEWAPDAATRNRILVRNPEVLYGFGASGA